MKLKFVVTALVLSLALPAAAQFKQITETSEVYVRDVRLPQNEVGTIAYKKCVDCSYVTKRVNESTVWEFNGEAMPLEKFRRNFTALDKSTESPVQVQYHLELDRVTRVWIIVR